MQYDNSDDPFGFWNDEPTRQLKRTHTGTRAHTDTRALPATRMVPVVRSERARPIVALHRPRNPLLTRIWVMAGVSVLLVPIALSLRTDNNQARASVIQGVDTVMVGQLPAPLPTEATLSPSTLAPTTLAATTVPTTPPPIEADVVTPAPTEPPTTAAPVQKRKAPTTTQATVAPAPTAVQAADQACAMTYTIVSGDAWSSIASRAKVTMKVLLAVNNATVNTLLLPGKTNCLPAGAVTPAPPTTKAPSTTQPPAPTQPKPPTTQATTPPVTTAPGTTQPAPPPNTYTRAQVTQIIRDVWPDDLEEEAIRIATRESNLRPTVKNYCCYGLFQIYYNAHRTWLASIGITSAAQLFDPRVNATAALALYNSNGWAPWATAAPTTTTVAV
jgi:hypothetical protein